MTYTVKSSTKQSGNYYIKWNKYIMMSFAEITYYLPPFGPLLKLFLGLSLGLLIASFLEALKLTKPIAKITKPIVKYAHLGDTSAAAFAMALFSPASANAFMGEKLEDKKITEKEVIISNLFNSLPSTLLHTPSAFFIAFSILGMPALIFISLTFSAVLLRTVGTVFLGRFLLPHNNSQGTLSYIAGDSKTSDSAKEGTPFWKIALKTGTSKFLKRCPRLIYVSIPIYCIIYYLQFFGFFTIAETWLAHNTGFDFLKPESLSVIMLYMAAEMQPAIIAAAALYNDNAIGGKEIVLALLIGNILSSPMCAIRHQLPAYMGYFNVRFAVKLIAINQTWRTISVLIITLIYYHFFF